MSEHAPDLDRIRIEAQLRGKILERERASRLLLLERDAHMAAAARTTDPVLATAHWTIAHAYAFVRDKLNATPHAEEVSNGPV